MKLTEENRKIALKLLDNYIKNGEAVIRKKDSFKKSDFQKLRIEVGGKIKNLLIQFSQDKINLDKFKTAVDGINKRNELWGFSGIKGQMFFNQLYNNSKNKDELSQNLKSALSLPRNIIEAGNKINNFEKYVLRLGQGIADRRTVPNPKSILYFLSYFWQISDKDKFPIFYTSMEEIFIESGLMFYIKEKDKYYNKFYEINNELKDLFESKTEKKIFLLGCRACILVFAYDGKNCRTET